MEESHLNPFYVAGLFDGEGSFEIRRTSRVDSVREFTFQLYATLQLRDIEVIELLQESYGGSISFAKPQKETHSGGCRWTITSTKVLALIEDIGDKLIIKEAHGQLAYKFQMHIAGQHYGAGLLMPDDEYEFRADCYQEMKFLNRRGDYHSKVS